jgi:uncharacterized SAM-binding protein YcdF (DUF218 family)
MVLAGVLLMRTRFRKTGKAFVVAGLSLLYLLSTALVSNLLIRTLEDDHPPLAAEVPEASAVVVLASGIRDLSHIGLGPTPAGGSIVRLAYGIRLYRAMKGAPLVISGGRADPSKPELSIGRSMAIEAFALGVPEDDVMVEDDSRNTFEGALYLLSSLKDRKKIVLVTSAFHMGRSAMLYRRVGFEVVPAPTAFMGERVPVHVSSIIPTAGALGMSSTAVYEYLCRLWYVLKDVFV